MAAPLRHSYIGLRLQQNAALERLNACGSSGAGSTNLTLIPQIRMRASYRTFRTACTALGMVAGASCASGRKLNSYLPIGAGAQYGNNTNDGVAFTLPLSEADAITRVRSAFARAGYAFGLRCSKTAHRTNRMAYARGRYDVARYRTSVVAGTVGQRL